MKLQDIEIRLITTPQGGREHWTQEYTRTHSFINMLFYSLAQKLLVTFNWLVSKQVKTFQPKIFI